MADPKTNTQVILRINDGPQRGQRTVVFSGMVLGRKEGDLKIDDQKLSVRHAQIEFKNNEWLLIDLNSANKIKVNDQRYDEVVLFDGLKFIIGSTEIEVIEREIQESAETPDEQSNQTPSPENPPEWKWQEILSELIERADKKTEDVNPDLHPFPSSVKIEFINGPQTGVLWQLGYGPRRVGSSTLEMQIVDARLPVEFEIDSNGSSFLLRPTMGSAVKVNGRPIDAKELPLRSGDKIELGSTKLRIHFES